jgi:hypothetical protein
MPLDTNIPLQVRPPRVLDFDPAEQIAKGYHLKDLARRGEADDLRLSQAKRSEADEVASRAIFKKHTGPGGELNKKGVLADLFQVNPELGMAAKVRFDQEELTKLNIERGERERVVSNAKLLGSLARSMSDQESYVAGVNRAVGLGLLTQQEAQQYLALPYEQMKPSLEQWIKQARQVEGQDQYDLNQNANTRANDVNKRQQQAHEATLPGVQAESTAKQAGTLSMLMGGVTNAEQYKSALGQVPLGKMFSPDFSAENLRRARAVGISAKDEADNKLTSEAQKTAREHYERADKNDAERNRIMAPYYSSPRSGVRRGDGRDGRMTDAQMQARYEEILNEEYGTKGNPGLHDRLNRLGGLLSAGGDKNSKGVWVPLSQDERDDIALEIDLLKKKRDALLREKVSLGFSSDEDVLPVDKRKQLKDEREKKAKGQEAKKSPPKPQAAAPQKKFTRAQIEAEAKRRGLDPSKLVEEARAAGGLDESGGQAAASKKSEAPSGPGVFGRLGSLFSDTYDPRGRVRKFYSDMLSGGN